MPRNHRGRAVRTGASRRQTFYRLLPAWLLGAAVGCVASASADFTYAQAPLPVDTTVESITAVEPITTAAPTAAVVPLPEVAPSSPIELTAAAEPTTSVAPSPSTLPKPPEPPTVQFGVPDFFPFASAKMQSGTPTTGPTDKAPDGKKAGPEWVDMSADKWTVKLGGHVQLDYINWPQASPAITGAQDYFEFRRLRLVADGQGYGTCDFRLQMTLEPETVGETPGVTSPDVKDAYFSMNEIPLLGRFRIGNFFVPFGLEQVTNDTNNVFLERSIPTQGIFTADREVGIAFYNCTPGQRLSWASGIFFDSIGEGLKERIDDNQGYRMSGRVSYLPYYDEPSNGRYLVYTGAGVLYTDDQNDSVRFRARPQIHEGPRLIASNNIAADAFTTGNLEGAIVWGPLTLQTEAYLSQVNRNTGGAATVNGNYMHLSWFLTGENRNFERFGQHGAQFGRNTPFSNVFFVPSFRSWGAWEFKTRWSRLDLTNVNAGEYNDVTVGLNWYWSDRTRVMFDWIHPITTAATTPFGAVTADILGLRFDFNW